MSRNWRSLRIALVAIVTAALLAVKLVWAAKPPKPPPVPPPAYCYTSLGTLGGDYSMVCGMNEQGDVVGYSMTAENRQHAFLSTTDGDGNRLPLVDLNDLIAPESGWYLQCAVDTNDDGCIVGRGYLNNKGASFLLSPDGSVVDVGAVVVAQMGGDADDTADVAGINNSGDIATDFVSVPDNSHEGCLLVGDTGEVIPIGRLDGRRCRTKCIGNRVDGSVQVAGVSVDEGAVVYHAFRFTYPTESGGELEDLESPRSRETSSGAGINDLGDVVGYRSSKRGQSAFRYTDDTAIEDLGTLGNVYSQARGINILGNVVGWSQTDDWWVDHGFLYTDQHGMLDLEELVIDWPPEVLGNMQPECINTAGQISGSIKIDTGVYGAAFLLTPVSQ
jgi:probable HAF family extracellular repeat protein